MAALPIHDTRSPDASEGGGGCGGSCGTSCGAGLEKIYPTTGVRWGAMSWIGEFSYKPGTVFKCGAKVVIQTERGVELGEQVSLTCNGCSKSVSREQIKRYIDNSGAEFYKLGSGRVLREASQADLDESAHLNSRVREDIDQCALLAAQLGLDMKVVTCEHLLGGERIVFYFRSEDRIDFRDLVKNLARHYQTRIEMRQVGARDEARLVADWEICGRECCCKNFLKKLRPVSMKMAKLQKTTLDPAKLSGRCGRLRCCLRYEHEGYEEMAAKLPRVGSRVGTDHGEGFVVDRQILTQLVLIRTDDERELAVPLEEIRAFNLPRPVLAPPDDDTSRGRPLPPPPGDRGMRPARPPRDRGDGRRTPPAAEGIDGQRTDRGNGHRLPGDAAPRDFPPGADDPVERGLPGDPVPDGPPDGDAPPPSGERPRRRRRRGRRGRQNRPDSPSGPPPTPEA